MSEFDKEAEREKLRKKFEEEKKDREATQRMSDLLLRGATMTNAHCNTCGDPIFRHDGQEFCPTCQREVDTGASAGGDGADVGDGSTGSAVEGAESEADTLDAASADEAASGAATPNAAKTDETTSNDHESAPTAGLDGAASAPTVDSQTTETGSGRVAGTGRSAIDNGELVRANAALGETIEQLAIRAREADDPRQAREWLAAAREAAEALRALSS